MKILNQVIYFNIFTQNSYKKWGNLNINKYFMDGNVIINEKK